MKFASTLAVIALINNTQAIRAFDNDDVSDLFNDDSQETETLKSIAEAEKVSGKKLPASIADENLKEILVQRSSIEFGNDDEFVKLSKGTTADKTLLQLDEQMYFIPEARPIGEVMAMIQNSDTTANLSESRFDKEIGGSNDSNDMSETLDSIKSAEL